MANTTDFIVKNGLQISSNLVVGSYALNSNITQIANGAIISGNVGIGTSTVAPGNTVAISGVAFHAGNIRIGNASTIGGILFSDGTFQNTAPSGTVNSGTAGQLTYYAGTGTAVSGNANATISAGGLTLGVAGTAAGSLSLAGATSGRVQIQTAAAAGSWAMTLPTGVGTAGYFLQTDGTSGVTTWAAAAPLASPGFTGTPTAPTATAGTSTTQLATTAFVQGLISAPWKSGNWYMPPVPTANGAPSPPNMCLFPVYVPNAVTINTLACLAGAAGTNISVNMAIYSCAQVGGAGTLVTNSLVSGTAWSPTAAYQSLQLSVNGGSGVVLLPGFYYLASQSINGASLVAATAPTSGGPHMNSALFGSTSFQTSNSDYTDLVFANTFTAGSFPSSITPSMLYNGSPSTAPLVFAKVA